MKNNNKMMMKNANTNVRQKKKTKCDDEDI